MKKLTVIVGILLLMAAASGAYAQGPFADVPTDHWAYEAVNDLQEKGILIGYPEGTFQGKRALTRYEFAVAISRMIPVIVEQVLQRVPGGAQGVSQEQLKALQERVTTLEGKPGAISGPIGSMDLDNLRKLMDQFRDELAALGVDVDALKRDVANLTERVGALEAEVARVKFTGNVDIFAVATKIVTDVAVDRDNRTFASGATLDELANTIGVVFDGDLNIAGKLSDTATANATLNFGNYLSYIGTVDDYAGGIRPAVLSGLEQVFPYYANVEAGFGNGSTIQIGRLPLQLTPYTLKKIDVDTYTSIVKTDSGDYPVDGAKLALRFGGVSLIGFAAKNNSNEFLANGLTSQANGGLYQGGGQFNHVGGAAAGGLDSIDQSAGVRAMIGTPFKGNLGLTYMRVAGQSTTDYDQADVLGADINFNYGKYNVGFEYAQSTTIDTDDVAIDVDELNKVFDGKIGATIGGLGLDLGYRSVERNYTGAGYWDKIGRWTNPTNVQGPYVNLGYGLTTGIKLVANGAFYNGVNNLWPNGPGYNIVNAAMNQEDDQLWKANVGLKWGLSPDWAVDAGYEIVKWSPDGGSDTDETYLTIGAAWQINPSAGLKLAYQIIEYSPAGSDTPYGDTAYKGNLAVAEFGVKF